MIEVKNVKEENSRLIDRLSALEKTVEEHQSVGNEVRDCMMYDLEGRVEKIERVSSLPKTMNSAKGRVTKIMGKPRKAKSKAIARMSMS